MIHNGIQLGHSSDSGHGWPPVIHQAIKLTSYDLVSTGALTKYFMEILTYSVTGIVCHNQGIIVLIVLGPGLNQLHACNWFWHMACYKGKNIYIRWITFENVSYLRFDFQVVLFCISDNFVNDPKCEEVFYYATKTVQKKIQLVLIGSSNKWAESSMGAHVATEVGQLSFSPSGAWISK